MFEYLDLDLKKLMDGLPNFSSDHRLIKVRLCMRVDGLCAGVLVCWCGVGPSGGRWEGDVIVGANGRGRGCVWVFPGVSGSTEGSRSGREWRDVQEVSAPAAGLFKGLTCTLEHAHGDCHRQTHKL